VDIYFARRLVGEKLQEAKERLPQGYGEPALGPNSSGLGQVFWYTVESADQKLSAMDLRTLHDWSVRLMLRTAPGVDDVTTWGGQEKQYQVLIHPQKLIKYGLSFKSVMEALAANNRQVGGQYVNLGQEQYLVRGLGLVANTTDIGNIVVAAHEGVPIYVRDVAEVKEAPAVRFGAVTRDGKEVTLGIALSRINENAKNVVNAVKQKLKLAQQALPAGVTLNPVYDRTDIVDKAIKTATAALIEGSILVAIVLFLFLGEIRSALVVIVNLAARHADRLPADAILRPVGQPHVAGRSGHRHRHDGRWSGGDGGKRFPPALPSGGQDGEPHPHHPGGGARGDQPDRLRHPHHHRRVPAAVLAHRPRRQAVQADGADHHLRHGGLADPDADAGAGARGADPEADGREGHLPRALGQGRLPAAARPGAGEQEAR
jgi:hypothetical protein